MSLRRFLVAALTALLIVTPADAFRGSAASADTNTPPEDDWVSAWSASMQGSSMLGFSGIDTMSGTLQAQVLHSLVPPPRSFSDTTVRQVMYLHSGGSALRLRLSNQFGAGTTTFPHVTVGIRQGTTGATIVPGTERTVTVDGEPSISIPEGRTVLTDPVPLTTTAFQHLVVSLFVPAGSGPATVHGNAMQTFFTAPGDETSARSDTAFAEHGIRTGGGTNLVTHLLGTLTTAVYYVSAVHVQAPEMRTLVTFGDSITDGFLANVNDDSRYPDELARRLQANPATDCLSVTAQAISGGRVTGDGIGPSALHRLETEVIDQPDVAGVIFLQGINDLGTALLQDRPRTADELIAGYREIATRLHDAGIPVWIGTLTPAGNLLRPTPYGLYSTPAAVRARHRVNAWLRGEGRQYFTGVIDFDRQIKDPLVADWISTLQYDSGDNLHPNAAGYRTMAQSVPLAQLAGLCR